MFYIRKYIIHILFLSILCLRLFGIDYGLPFFLVSDEEVVVGSALKMLQLKSLIPILNPSEMKILIYPPFLPIINLIGILPFILFLYIKSGFPEINQFNNICLDNIELFFLGARVGNVFFNLLTIFFIYKICMLLFNSKRIAVFSIIFLATDFTFNLTGHFARHWNTSSLFIWISMFYAFKLLYSNSYKIYFYASLSSGIGFGVSYIFGGFSFIFFTIFHFLKYKIKYLKNLIFSIFIFITLGLISIFIHPYPLLRLIEDKANNVTALYVDNSFLSTIFYYLESMFFLNPTLILLTIISLIYCFYKKLFLNELIIFLLFFLTFITLLHFTVNSEHRYLMPTIPALAIISSVGLNEVLKNKKFIFQVPIIIFLFSYPLITSFFTNYLLSQNDTRTQALIWLNQNAEKKSKIANGLKNIYIVRDYQKYRTKSDHSRENLIGIDKNELRKNFSFSNISEKFLNKESNLHLSKYLISNKYDYILISYKYKDNKHYRISKKFYKELKNNYILEKKIESNLSMISTPDLQSTEGFKFPIYKIFDFNSFGPTVEIYKFKN